LLARSKGDSFEVDGKWEGTIMAKKSSIFNPNRNPRWTQAAVENYVRQYLSVRKVIWLPGEQGITDDHIEGTVRFANGNIIAAHSKCDCWDWRIPV